METYFQMITTLYSIKWMQKILFVENEYIFVFVSVGQKSVPFRHFWQQIICKLFCRICRITSRHGHSAWTPYWQLISRLYFLNNMNVLPGALRSVFARRAGLRRPASDGRWCPRPGPSTLSARSVCWAAGSIGQRSSQACSCANQTSTRYSNESGRVQSPDGAATAQPAPPCPPGYKVYPAQLTVSMLKAKYHRFLSLPAKCISPSWPSQNVIIHWSLCVIYISRNSSYYVGKYRDSYVWCSVVSACWRWSIMSLGGLRGECHRDRDGGYRMECHRSPK